MRLLAPVVAKRNHQNLCAYNDGTSRSVSNQGCSRLGLPRDIIVWSISNASKVSLPSLIRNSKLQQQQTAKYHRLRCSFPGASYPMITCTQPGSSSSQAFLYPVAADYLLVCTCWGSLPSAGLTSHVCFTAHVCTQGRSSIFVLPGSDRGCCTGRPESHGLQMFQLGHPCRCLLPIPHIVVVERYHYLDVPLTDLFVYIGCKMYSLTLSPPEAEIVIAMHIFWCIYLGTPCSSSERERHGR